MKQFKLTAFIFLSASLLASATSAHVLMKDEPLPEAVASYNWTGFYAGLNAGAVQHTMDMTDNDATSFNATIEQVLNPKFTGGFQIGYRRQLDFTKASGVYGLEFSANFSNAKFEEEYGSPFANYQLNSENVLKNILLLQLIGGIAADRTLLFLAAGLSWSNITGNVESVNGIPFFHSFDVAKKALGAGIGGGIEYAITEAISARLKVDVILSNSYSTSDDVGDDFEITNRIVQGTLGLNYKFG